MKKITIQELLISEEAVLKETLALLDQTALGIAFVVNHLGKLTGVVTDGDIRRALLKNLTIDTPMKQIMTQNFKSLPITTPREKILKTLDERITIIPLLDEEGRPVDFSSRTHLHHIPVMEPNLEGNEMAYVVDCLKTNWISSQGSYVTQFEERFQNYHGDGFALAVSNGTAALHLALVTLGIKAGDEVLVPDFTFAASINAVIHAGATPVLVDVDKDTWTMDPIEAEKAITSKTKAMMPVHLYGHPANMDHLMALAKKHHLLVIEDCAEALGALYKNKLVGTFGEASAYSFFGNKLITTGEGGMILFRKESDYIRAKQLRDHGMDPQKRYWHTEIGFNYRLTNLQAAIGLAQMEKIDLFISKKINLAVAYKQMLKNIPGLTPPQCASWAKSVYWLYTVLVEDESGFNRDELMYKLLQNGIETRAVFYPLHVMPLYQKFGGENKFPNSIEISRKGISLPSAVKLDVSQIDHINEVFQRIFQIKELVRTAPQ